MENRAEAIANHASGGLTAGFGLLLLVTIVALAFEEKLHAKKSVIIGVSAIIALLLGTLFGLLPFGDVTLPGGETVNMPVYIPAIDWGALAIIIGSDIFVAVTSRSGLFSWIAIRLTRLSRGDPLKLLWYYGLMTVLFSAMLNNVTAMVIVGSLTAVSLSRLNRTADLGPFLLVEALLTNVGGLLTLISSVPNIIVGRIAGITFLAFFVKAAPFVLVLTAITLVQAAKLFGVRALRGDEEKEKALEVVAGFDENDGVTSRRFFWFSAVMLVAFIGTIAAASVLPLVRELGIGFVAIAFATVMLLAYRSQADEFYQAIDWDLIGFFMGLFVVLNVMEHAHVIEALGTSIEFLIGDGHSATGTGALLLSSALCSSVMDNVPVAAMLAKILAATGIPGTSRLWWAVVFGANLGGNLTPIGSVSSLVAIAIMQKHGVKMPFMAFCRKVFPFVLIEIALSMLYVLVS